MSDRTERYLRAMRSSLDGLWDWDLGTGLVHISPNWREILELPDEDSVHVDEALFGRLHPDDDPAVRAVIDAHLTGGAPCEVEFRLRTASGPYRWYWARGEAERDDQGRPTRMSGGIRDVTSRREAEDLIRRTERILRLRSACNLALVHTGTERDLLSAVCEVAIREGGYRLAWVGYAEHDETRRVRPVAVTGADRTCPLLLGVSWSERDEGGGGPTGRCLRSGRAVATSDLASEPGPASWRDAAGALGIASACAIPLTAGGRTIGALNLYAAEPGAFDLEELSLLRELGNDLSFGIQARRDARAVAEQRAKLELFREAIERSTDAIFVADVETERFVDFNLTAATQLGYTPQELLTLGPSDVAPALREPGSLARTIARIRGGEHRSRRTVHRRKDGTEFPVEISLSLLESGGRRLALAIARDVSERVAAEEGQEALRRQLEQSQKLESVGRLAGGIAHDFNNILTVVNGTADLVLSDLDPSSPFCEDLRQIRAAGERAATLTRQLLAFSRRQVMHRKALALNPLVSELLGLTRRVLGAHVEIRMDLAEDLDLVHADPGQIEQVLMNLCVNARDAMPQGGTLTVATRNVVVDAALAARQGNLAPGPHVLLSVGDTGTGMDEATRSQIFEPFFTTKPEGKGTGLGLAMVYGIVRQTGGAIVVESEPGRGTVFEIYLPAGGAPTPREERPVGPAVTPARPALRTVLLVEHEPAVRGLVRRLLERAGYRVLEAASGKEATRIGEQAGPGDIHLLLTDAVMPEMSGTQLAETLVERHPGMEVLLADGSMAGLHGRGENGHAPRWRTLEKPYEVDEILREIREALGNR